MTFVNELLFTLENCKEEVVVFIKDPSAYLSKAGLSPDQFNKADLENLHEKLQCIVERGFLDHVNSGDSRFRSRMLSKIQARQSNNLSFEMEAQDSNSSNQDNLASDTPCIYPDCTNWEHICGNSSCTDEFTCTDTDVCANSNSSCKEWTAECKQSSDQTGPTCIDNMSCQDANRCQNSNNQICIDHTNCNDRSCRNDTCYDSGYCTDTSSCFNQFDCQDGNNCRDNSCVDGSQIGGKCGDLSTCKDVACMNLGNICADVAGCTDNKCTNDALPPSGGCTDSSCRDITECFNDLNCSDNDCSDENTCSNVSECKDNSCTDYVTCSDQDCIDETSCVNVVCNDSCTYNQGQCTNFSC